MSPIVVVQKDAASEVEPSRAFASSRNEGGVAGETPLGAHLRPIAAALVDRGVDVG